MQKYAIGWGMHQLLHSPIQNEGSITEHKIPITLNKCGRSHDIIDEFGTYFTDFEISDYLKKRLYSENEYRRQKSEI